MKYPLQIGLTIAWLILAISASAAVPSNPGMQMLEMENYAGAQAYFQMALQKDPKDAAATADMAKVYLSQGQNKTGVDWAEKAVALAPKNASYQILQGDAYAAYVDDVGFFSKLGIAHKILAAYQQAVQADPESTDAQFSLFQYYIAAPGIAGGSTDKAKEQIAALDKLDPVQAAIARATLAMKNKDNKQAEGYLRAAVKLDKTGEANTQLGLFLLNQKRFNDAIAALQDGISKDPNNSINYYYVGLSAVLGKNNVQAGMQALQKYLTMPHDWHPDTPTYKWAHYRLGMLYGATGDKVDEKAQYEAALKLDPDFKEAKKALATI
ncbi:MAG: tetratricopeptide repeat protein [Gammaproteobacteria bacterium]